MIIPLLWIGLFAAGAVFVVMFALGPMLGRERIAAALNRTSPPMLESIIGYAVGLALAIVVFLQ